jgi:hypothetical protein
VSSVEAQAAAGGGCEGLTDTRNGARVLLSPPGLTEDGIHPPI